MNFKKILITGSTGMVGKNVTERFENSSYNLITPSRSELDLCIKKNVEDFIHQTKPDLIIHCAGRVGGIQANMNNHIEAFIENFDMGRNLVMAAYKNNIKNFLNIASSCVYPKNIKGLLKEEMILQGLLEPTNEGYALGKIGVLKLCQYIDNQSENFKYKTLIPCNLYGKYDSFNPEKSHLIPAIIRKIDLAISNNSNQVEIWGDGSARREFMYTEDLADFICQAIKRFEDIPNIINIGLGFDYSIDEYYKFTAEVLNYRGKFIYDKSKPEGMKKKTTDITLQKKFGWNANTSLLEGLKKTYQYYLNEK